MRIASNCFASLRVYKYRAKWVAFQKGLDTVGVRGSTIGVRAPIKYLRTRGYGRDEYGTMKHLDGSRDRGNVVSEPQNFTRRTYLSTLYM